jgi:hypothetical protein
MCISVVTDVVALFSSHNRHSKVDDRLSGCLSGWHRSYDAVSSANSIEMSKVVSAILDYQALLLLTIES